MKKNGLLPGILGVLLLWTQHLSAQQNSPGSVVQGDTLRGTVIDSASGQPLEGVTVSLEGTKIRTLTHRDGSFSLHGSGRKRTLLFTYVSYGSVRAIVDGRESVSVKL